MSSTKEKKSFIEENPKLFGLGVAAIAAVLLIGLYKWKTGKGLSSEVSHYANILDNNAGDGAGDGAGAGAGAGDMSGGRTL